MPPRFVTVKECQEAFAVPRANAWRGLERAFRSGELLKRKLTLWNGQAYIERNYYAWIPYAQRCEYAIRRHEAMKKDAARLAR